LKGHSRKRSNAVLMERREQEKLKKFVLNPRGMKEERWRFDRRQFRSFVIKKTMGLGSPGMTRGFRLR